MKKQMKTAKIKVRIGFSNIRRALNRNRDLKINILGTEYAVILVSYYDDILCDGRTFYCDQEKHEIYVGDIENSYLRDFLNEKESDGARKAQKEIYRGALINAFMAESEYRDRSLNCEAICALEMDMADWFAIQMPKLLEAFRKADCI